MSRRLLSLALIAALSVLLNACLAPRYARPSLELPEQWNAGAAAAQPVGDRWWAVFEDQQLDTMVDEALKQNANLQLAVARVDEARALLGQARGEQFPSVSVNASGSRTQSSISTAIPLFPGVPRTTDDYRAGVNVAYEVDIFGRLRNASRAARADLLATEAARQTVQIALAADVVQGYFALRALDEQVAATHRALATRGESLSLQKMRFQVGAISEFEYRQLEAEVLAARAQLPALEQRRAQQENALAVLLGKSPRAIYQGGMLPVADGGDADRLDDEPLAVAVPAGLPSELLLRRPDLIEGEQRLIAANARIGVARAGYFPVLSLTGLYGSESAKLSDLFSGPAGVWQFAGALTQPIWGGGRASARVKAANARQRQALAQYQQAIQNAFREVRDALVAQTKMREQFEAETQRVAALRDALRLAKLRYENGIASQLDVLDTERNLLAAELNRSEALRAQRASLANLFKALGGGYATIAAGETQATDASTSLKPSPASATATQ